jgi:hypothetical protein
MVVRCWCGRFLGNARRVDATFIELSDLSDPAASGPRGRARTGPFHIRADGATTLDLVCPRHGPHQVTGADLEQALRHRRQVFRVPRRVG